MSVLHSPISVADQRRLQVLAHLEELLESPAFSGSRRRQAFLRYVVEETLAGRGSTIKERNLAVDVFGRDSDFDAQSASIVRVTGGEVRKRLAQAYASGLDHGLRIELPLGSYQPVFHFASADAVSAPLPAAARTAPMHARRWFQLLAAFALVCILAASLLTLRKAAVAPSAADRLWQPFLDPGTPVLISLVSLTVQDTRHRGKGAAAKNGDPVSAGEIVPLDMSYVGTGGALGAALFAEQLALRRQPFQVKFGRDVAFADLKHGPAILLGPSRLMQELSQKQRFRIERGEEQSAIVDSQVAARQWSLPRATPSVVPVEGYSLVTRWLNSDSGHPILTVAGLDPRDTQAGVEFLAKGPLFGDFSKSLPADWEHKSFQVVLHNTIHGNSPGSLSVVAWHVW